MAITNRDLSILVEKIPENIERLLEQESPILSLYPVLTAIPVEVLALRALQSALQSVGANSPFNSALRQIGSSLENEFIRLELHRPGHNGSCECP